MILPSDSDLPPDRNDNLPPDSGAWWVSPDQNSGTGKSGSDPAGEDDDGIPYPDDSDGDEGADDGDDFDGTQPTLSSIAGPGWRKDLYKDLLDSLRELEAIEDPDDEFAPPEPPDLFTFFGELAALRNELRHQGQRTNDNLNQLEKTLAPLRRPAPGKTAGPAAPGASAWPVEDCLALLSAWDLLPEAVSAGAFTASFQPLFQAAGLVRIPTLGLPFDPATMTLTGTEPAARRTAPLVLRETTAGFLRDGTVLRPAGVILSAPPAA